MLFMSMRGWDREQSILHCIPPSEKQIRSGINLTAIFGEIKLCVDRKCQFLVKTLNDFISLVNKLDIFIHVLLITVQLYLNYHLMM